MTSKDKTIKTTDKYSCFVFFGDDALKSAAEMQNQQLFRNPIIEKQMLDLHAFKKKNYHHKKKMEQFTALLCQQQKI